MTIKKLLTLALVATTVGTANATDLYVYSLSNPSPVKQLNSIRYVEFSAADITVKQQMGTTTKVALADFDFLKFSPATIVTGIGDVMSDNIKARVSVDGGKVKVTGGTIDGLYAADGRLLSPSGQNVSEAQLPQGERHGIYIVKVKTASGTKSYKITK